MTRMSRMSRGIFLGIPGQSEGSCVCPPPNGRRADTRSSASRTPGYSGDEPRFTVSVERHSTRQPPNAQRSVSKRNRGLTERLQAQRLVAAETEPPTEKVPPTEMFSPSIPAESTALGAGDACAEGVGGDHGGHVHHELEAAADQVAVRAHGDDELAGAVGQEHPAAAARVAHVLEPALLLQLADHPITNGTGIIKGTPSGGEKMKRAAGDS